MPKPHRPVYHRKMFFYASKILWFLATPGNVVLLVLCAGVPMLWTRWRRAGRWLVSAAFLAAFLMAVLPMGTALYVTLENRFPTVRQLPERVDGIVVLGGVADQFVTRARGQVALNGAVERLTSFAAMARRYPNAKLVFTSGSGKLRQDLKEADVLAPVLRDLGIDMGRVILENRSRNTHENALMSYALVTPGADETWILITSAFHMPRAVGCFRRVGWPVIPYPVDFNFAGDEQLTLSFNLAGGMGRLGGGLHEWLGLLFYWLTDKTDAFFPSPER